jgi:hypothetical protein
MHTTPPYFTPNGSSIDTITIKNISDFSLGWDYQFQLGTAGYLHMNAQDANDYAVTLVRRLVEDGRLSMENAEYIAAMTHRVLQDPAEALEAAMMEAGENF